VALVGNARSLAEQENGAEIDGAELVVRINGAPLPSPASHGTRTDWLAMSMAVDRATLARGRPGGRSGCRPRGGDCLGMWRRIRASC
jgi:hypothetical protein